MGHGLVRRKKFQNKGSQMAGKSYFQIGFHKFSKHLL